MRDQPLALTTEVGGDGILIMFFFSSLTIGTGLAGGGLSMSYLLRLSPGLFLVTFISTCFIFCGPGLCTSSLIFCVLGADEIALLGCGMSGSILTWLMNLVSSLYLLKLPA